MVIEAERRANRLTIWSSSLRHGHEKNYSIVDHQSGGVHVFKLRGIKLFRSGISDPFPTNNVLLSHIAYGLTLTIGY